MLRAINTRTHIKIRKLILPLTRYPYCIDVAYYVADKTD
jgi:hypothetical protein